MAKYSISRPMQNERVDDNFLFKSDDDNDFSISGFSDSIQETLTNN